MRRPKKPKRPAGLRWIYPVWRQTTEAWEWAAARRIDGRLVWEGKSYPTPEEAFDVAKDMLARRSTAKVIGTLTFAQACKRAVETLLANGGSEHTATGYRIKFATFQRIIDPEAPVLKIVPEALEAFKLRRMGKPEEGGHGVSPNTVAGDLRILHRVFELAGLSGERNPVAKVGRVKQSDPDRPFLTMEQVHSIAGRIRKSGHPAAKWHGDLIEFLALTGARAFEIERLRSDHVVWRDNGSGAVLLHGVKGKRARVRRVNFPKRWAKLVRRVLARAVDGPPLEPVTIAVICKRWRRELKLPQLSGRILRRSFATESARHGSLHYVQAALGHTQLTTTQLYLGVDDEAAQEVAERLGRSLAGGRARSRRRAPAPKPSASRASGPLPPDLPRTPPA